jgi:hypothetical protein
MRQTDRLSHPNAGVVRSSMPEGVRHRFKHKRVNWRPIEPKLTTDSAHWLCRRERVPYL